MSDHIPFEIQREIIQNLPVKSVVRFRSVSKQWKCLIDSPKFINDHYHINHTHSQNHLLVKNSRGYTSFIDNDNFPNRKFSVTPQYVDRLWYRPIIGSSHGLICFRRFYYDSDIRTDVVVLWNPTLRKSVRICIPNVLYGLREYTVIGFGVCPDTTDPKLVKINVVETPSVCWEVQVFTLSSSVWRSISTPLIKSRELWNCDQLFIGGLIYFNVFNYKNTTGALFRYNSMVSFDLKSEEFAEVCLPDGLVKYVNVTMKNVNESLGVLEDHYYGDVQVFDVWVMKNDGVTESFTKMFTIRVPCKSVWNSVSWFRRNGEAVIKSVDKKNRSEKLKVYEPSSGRIKGSIEIIGSQDTLLVNSYLETLLLLNETSSIIH